MAYSSDIPGNSVGKALKKYFEQKGYSQQQIADILDVHQTNIRETWAHHDCRGSRWQRSHPEIYRIQT